MTIGSRFLDRVLAEGKKDVDGFKDNFDITTLPATSPALANLPMPLARQIVQLYHLLGVSLETLESRPKAVREAATEVADEMRTNRPLRVAAQRLFSALASAKGFARAEVTEAEDFADSGMNDKKVTLMGSTVVKQIEALLAALKLPAGLLQRAMRRDAAALTDTAGMILKGAVRSKFAMLASELGVDLMGVGREVEVTEEMGISDMLAAKKIFDKIKGTPNLKTAAVEQQVKRYLDMVGKQASDVKFLTAKVIALLQDEGLMEEIDPQGANRYADAVMHLISALGVPDIAFARNAKVLLGKYMKTVKDQTNVEALIPLIITLAGRAEKVKAAAAQSATAQPGGGAVAAQGSQGTQGTR